MEQQNIESKTYEVEKKLLLTTAQSLKLIEGFDIDNQIELSDTYWKDSGLHLPLRDRWLRKRGDNEWVLKIPTSVQKTVLRSVDKYREVTDFEDIKQILGVMGVSEDFEQDLTEFEYKQWFTISSVRTIYKSKIIPDFTITCDSTNFGYEVWEVEMCVASEFEMISAETKILDFISKQGLVFQGYVRGKVHEYLYKYNRDEFDELARAGLMK